MQREQWVIVLQLFAMAKLYLNLESISEWKSPASHGELAGTEEGPRSGEQAMHLSWLCTNVRDKTPPTSALDRERRLQLGGTSQPDASYVDSYLPSSAEGSMNVNPSSQSSGTSCNGQTSNSRCTVSGYPLPIYSSPAWDPHNLTTAGSFWLVKTSSNFYLAHIFFLL